MTKIESKRQINGTFGTVWVNNEKWMDVESFEAKVTLSFEDVNMAGDLATHKKLSGWAGEGSMTVKKVYSRGATLMANVARGSVPNVSIVGKLADPDAFGAERVEVRNVTFNEFTLMAFEQKTLATEELPFNFSDYQFIDLIRA